VTDVEAWKRQAAERAVEWVEPGMVVGLGTGTTAVWAVRRIGERLADGTLHDIVGVPTATATAEEAERVGIRLLGDDVPWEIDFTIDGADEVDPALHLLKGGGGALLREKLLIAAARHVLIVAESPKLVDHLGTTKALPVEVVRFAWPSTRRRLLDLLPSATLRLLPDATPVITDEGHHLLDCTLPPADLGPLATALKSTLGVVEHGLFLDQADEVLLGHPDGSVQHLRR